MENRDGCFIWYYDFYRGYFCGRVCSDHIGSSGAASRLAITSKGIRLTTNSLIISNKGIRDER